MSSKIVFKEVLFQGATDPNHKLFRIVKISSQNDLGLSQIDGLGQEFDHNEIKNVIKGLPKGMTWEVLALGNENKE